MAKVVFLGKLSSVAKEHILAPDALSKMANVAGLRAHLWAQYPDAFDWSAAHVKIALDGAIASETDAVMGVKEIALMPPVGGG